MNEPREENAEAEESLSNRVVAGGEEALATKLLLSQLAEAAKPPRTNREFVRSLNVLRKTLILHFTTVVASSVRI